MWVFCVPETPGLWSYGYSLSINGFAVFSCGEIKAVRPFLWHQHRSKAAHRDNFVRLSTIAFVGATCVRNFRGAVVSFNFWSLHLFEPSAKQFLIRGEKQYITFDNIDCKYCQDDQNLLPSSITSVRSTPRNIDPAAVKRIQNKIEMMLTCHLLWWFISFVTSLGEDKSVSISTEASSIFVRLQMQLYRVLVGIAFFSISGIMHLYFQNNYLVVYILAFMFHLKLNISNICILNEFRCTAALRKDKS